ncbi:MAG: hypothetical protein NTY19_45545 [Planctomycetota bacterium]|nr:hypothetical protein [Planctomycetota bacterium]
MKYTGHVFDWPGTTPYGNVVDAVVTKSSLSLDWSEEGIKGHLKATSRDGVHYKGVFGYPRPDPDDSLQLTLYRAEGEILLFGTWYRHEDGAEGIWAFRLSERQLTGD